MREQIEELLARWAWHIDHHEYAELATLFTDNAILSTGGHELHGREEIQQRYQSRQGVRSTRHVYSSLILDQHSPTSARATSVWICYASNNPIPVEDLGAYLVADFVDEFVCCEDGWRISQRTIVPVFRESSRAPVAS